MLGVSPATVSRAVRAAGDRICRMGRRRGTIYALRRRIRGLPPSIPVFRIDPEGSVQRVGELHPLADGGHWLEFDGRGVLYEGTPPFVADMQPQGYLGAPFARLHADLELPQRLSDWNDDHRLIALARRGEDCVGDLVTGEESLDRLLARRAEGPKPVPDEMYPQWADTVLDRVPGSSAGGEGPKFLVYGKTAQRHVLVKFTSSSGSAADERWRDLLACEAIALDTLRDYGFAVPPVRVFDLAGRRFLEVGRFDRSGQHGRCGVMSMAALDAEYVGEGSDWTRVARAMHGHHLLSTEDTERIAWLDAFGMLIANSDRHPGNISFLVPPPDTRPPRAQLAPVYDMLPMAFAPAAGELRQVTLKFDPPRAAHVESWPHAARAAIDYWQRVGQDARISHAFRQIAAETVEQVVRVDSTWQAR